VLVAHAVWSPPAANAESSSALRSLFADPPRDYSTGPLWVWNDDLTDKQIVDTLRDMAAQNVRAPFVHPRPGLMTPYLSERWMHLWETALAEAERLDMNIWIYDENSYPSGFAGGFVPDAMPESRGQGLAIREHKKPPASTEDTVAIFRLTDNGSEDVSAKVRSGESLPEGKYLAATIVRAGARGWFGGKWYVDLMRDGVTEKFLDITLEAYRKRIGKHFGKRVPGSFTDEPHLTPAGHLPWTDALPRLFKERWGYDLIEHLPALNRRVGDWKRVRHNYMQLLHERFVERWGKPYYEYCEKHNLEFTGHYWEHSWPSCHGVPDNMAMYAWHQRPAIDTLMNQYSENVNAQFGNVRAVRELGSVANQLGRRRTLCEAYGAGGWDLRFEDMKRIGDWLYVLGVNTLNEHLAYITIRGARKRDHPQSFSYHTPWWEGYHVLATYFTRLSAALSHGQQVNSILLLEPTTTAWMYQPGDGKAQKDKLGATFQALVTALEKAPIKYDIGCEDIMARNGSGDGAKLIVGERAYTTLVIPPHTENLNAKTMDQLEAYVGAGGRVWCCGPPPALIDGRPSDRGSKVARHSTWNAGKPEPPAAADIPAILRQSAPTAADDIVVTHTENERGILFQHTRRFDDGWLLFLANTSIDSPSSGQFACGKGFVEQWDLETGNIAPYPQPGTPQQNAARMSVPFELAPCGSLLLFVSNDTKGRKAPAPSPTEAAKVIPPTGELKIRRVDVNVLTLDYVDITAGGETKKDLYVLKAADFAFRKNGLDGNPWSRAVQFRDELITKKLPADSGFEATYKFTIADRVPDSLSIVIERGDLYTVTCNGQQLAVTKDKWWLDKAFPRIDLAAAARIGENAVTIKAAPLTMLGELEAAFIIGDFALEPAEKGFVIAPPQPLQLGPWNGQGLPLYGHRVSYTHKFAVSQPKGRYVVDLPSWYGSVAKVTVNGKPAGHVWHQPWECDVTDRIKPGPNEIEVVVTGTLKNTLGPHHGKPPLGSAWPSMWDKAPEQGPPPGKDYSTVGYGLFKPFVLRQKSR